MIAITGITGNIGGQVARNLLAAHKSIRGVVRDARRAEGWLQRGAEIATADIGDAVALAEAFKGVEGVFMLIPPNFDPSPDFPEARAIGVALKSALEAAKPPKVVYLSTVGAQATQTNLLSQHTIIEQSLRELPLPITFLRPGWFMENSSWDVAPARESGIVPSFLEPLDKAFPMVATADIALVATELLLETWTGHRVVELEGPCRVTPNEIAATFAELLGHPVKMEAVPRATWETLFKAQGMKNPLPRIQMLDGFNQGWIDFESGKAGTRKGEVALKTVLKTLVDREVTSVR